MPIETQAIVAALNAREITGETPSAVLVLMVIPAARITIPII